MKDFNLLSALTPELDLQQSIIGLLFCIIAAFILRSVYIRRSISLSGKFHIGTVIPLLSTITFLIILIVKSSLALSLGLVGALSIVRFRTPIKEPEELVYLFFAITIGLGYAAGQIVATTIVFITIIFLIVVVLSRKSISFENEFNLVMDSQDNAISIDRIIRVLENYSDSVEISKFGMKNNQFSAFFKVILKSDVDVDKLGDDLRAIHPSISYSFYEARVLQ